MKINNNKVSNTTQGPQIAPDNNTTSEDTKIKLMANEEEKTKEQTKLAQKFISLSRKIGGHLSQETIVELKHCTEEVKKVAKQLRAIRSELSSLNTTSINKG